MTDYPFVEARWKTVTDGRTIDLIVLHTPEAPIGPATAERVARYFQTVTRRASTHLVSDTDSVVRCVLDKDIAYGAAGANRSGLHIELNGYVATKPAEWATPDGLASLDTAAAAVAAWCAEHAITATFLTARDLLAGRRRGITTHAEVQKAWPSTGHTDPGPNFPLDRFLALVRGRGVAPAVVPPPQTASAPPPLITPQEALMPDAATQYRAAIWIGTDGRGWADIPAPRQTLLGAVPEGTDPRRDHAYGPTFAIAAQPNATADPNWAQGVPPQPAVPAGQQVPVITLTVAGAPPKTWARLVVTVA